MTADRIRKTGVIRARCDQALKDRVIALAARAGLEEADIIRLAVTDYLARHDSTSTTTVLTVSSQAAAPLPPTASIPMSPATAAKIRAARARRSRT